MIDRQNPKLERGIHRRRFVLIAGLLLVALIGMPTPSVAISLLVGASMTAGPCEPCDANCDSFLDILDIPPFVDALVQETSGCSSCAGDVDNNGTFDGRDVQPFIDCLLGPPPSMGACCTGTDACIVTLQAGCAGVWMGPDSSCDPNPCDFGSVTAYRPQHGAGYFPFAKTAVAEADEEDAAAGPGIRINAPGDSDPAGEDDLIELLIENDQPGISLALRRTNSALSAWTTRTKLSGSEIPFTNDRTDALVLGGGGTSLSIWVERAAAAHGDGELHLEPLSGAYSLDTLRFHTFRSIVMSLGGEGQVPSVPVDPNHGTFVVATALYEQGYDVHIYDEDNVSADGNGAVYNEVVTAVADRLIDEVSIYGYSHGGGSTYDLSERLDNNRPGIGVFEIVATSYVDAVENDSDIDVSQELRRPPSTGYHANHYQVGTFSDFFLDGGPVPNSDPGPSGLNVETIFWGVGATHYVVDDYSQVRDFIEMGIATRLTP
ncbi:MAG TPA: hypothetical protein VJZ71_07580 [Phycisphaerae bacterium]|nr:hypothetical protein [Phycisphaerae bacterium]